MRTLAINGITLPWMVTGKLIHPTARRDVEFIEVPGRDGALSIDNKWYHPVVIPWQFAIDNNSVNPGETVSNVLAKLPQNKIMVFEDSLDGGWARRGIITKVSSDIYKSTQIVDIEVTCEPKLFLPQGDVALVANTSNNYTAISNPWLETLPVIEFSNVSGDIFGQFNKGANNDSNNLFTITGLSRPKILLNSKAQTLTDQNGVSVLSAFSGVFPKIWGNDPADGETTVETRAYITMGANTTATAHWEQVKL